MSATHGEPKGHAFPKAFRITERGQYLDIQRNARRLGADHFVLLWRANGLPVNRLGITTSRRVGKAVVRNSIRRQIREAFRLTGTDFHPNLDLVVVARPSAGGQNPHILRTDLSRAWDILRLRLSRLGEKP